jgi:hypothetical protein
MLPLRSWQAAWPLSHDLPLAGKPSQTRCDAGVEVTDRHPGGEADIGASTAEAGTEPQRKQADLARLLGSTRENTGSQEERHQRPSARDGVLEALLIDVHQH